jgi:hypothetical protein
MLNFNDSQRIVNQDLPENPLIGKMITVPPSNTSHKRSSTIGVFSK